MHVDGQVLTDGGMRLSEAFGVSAVAVPGPVQVVDAMNLALLLGRRCAVHDVSVDEFGAGDAADADAVSVPVPLLMRDAVPARDLHDDSGARDADDGADDVPRAAQAVAVAVDNQLSAEQLAALKPAT